MLKRGGLNLPDLLPLLLLGQGRVLAQRHYLLPRALHDRPDLRDLLRRQGEFIFELLQAMIAPPARRSAGAGDDGLRSLGWLRGWGGGRRQRGWQRVARRHWGKGIVGPEIHGESVEGGEAENEHRDRSERTGNFHTEE